MHALGGDETFAQLAAFANLFGYLASATILQSQFRLAFDLFSIRDKFAHQVAAAFFFISLALTLSGFISTQVWEHVKSSSDVPGLHPSAYANNVLEFLLSFVLFLASVTTVIPNTRGGPRATGANDTVSFLKESVPNTTANPQMGIRLSARSKYLNPHTANMDGRHQWHG